MKKIIPIIFLVILAGSPAAAETLFPMYSLTDSECQVGFGEEIMPGLGIAMLTCRTFTGTGWSDSTDFLLYRFDGLSLIVTSGEGEAKKDFYFIVAADSTLRLIDPVAPVLEPLEVVEDTDEDL